MTIDIISLGFVMDSVGQERVNTLADPCYYNDLGLSGWSFYGLSAGGQRKKGCGNLNQCTNGHWQNLRASVWSWHDDS